MNATEYKNMYYLEERHWWYQSMHRLIFSTLEHLHKAAGEPKWSILDAGCGTGAIAQKVQRFGQVQAIDLSELALSYSRHRGLAPYLTQASVTTLPMPKETFDLIVSIDVLYSVEHDQQALHEFYRVLKPGGLLIMNLPALKWLRGQHDEVVHGLRRYTVAELTAKLTQAGFVIEKLSFANSILLLFVAPYRLASNWLQTNNQPPQSDVFLLPKIINNTLAYVMQLESQVIPYVSLPIGMSLFSIAKKPFRTITASAT